MGVKIQKHHCSTCQCWIQAHTAACRAEGAHWQPVSPRWGAAILVRRGAGARGRGYDGTACPADAPPLLSNVLWPGAADKSARV